MNEIRWNPLKSQRLKKIRGMSFEEILKTQLVGIKDHPARENQEVMLFDRGGVYLGRSFC